MNEKILVGDDEKELADLDEQFSGLLLDTDLSENMQVHGDDDDLDLDADAGSDADISFDDEDGGFDDGLDLGGDMGDDFDDIDE